MRWRATGRWLAHGAMLMVGVATLASPALAATSLEASVRVLYLRGRAVQAEPMLQRALDGPYARTRVDSLRKAALLDLLAEAQWRVGHSKAPAESIAQLAVDWRRAMHGPDSDPVSRSLATQARVWRVTMLAESSIAGLQRALAMHERHVPRPDTVSAEMLVSMGNVFRQLQRGEDAVDAQERALALRRQALGDMHRDVGRTLLNLALAYETAGRMQQRLEAEREALEIFEQTRPLDSLGVFYTCKNHVGALFEANRGAEAGPYIARWLELRPHISPDGSLEDATAEESAGLYQLIAGDPKSAKAHFDRCDTIITRGGLAGFPDNVAMYWLHRSQLEEALGRPDSALGTARRAERMFATRYQANPAPFSGVEWEASLDRLGQLLAYRDSLAAAERAFATGAALAARHRSPEHPEYARLTEEMAAVRMRMGRWDSAAPPALLAAGTLTRHIRREFARMTLEEALRYRGSGATAALNVLLSILSAHPDSALAQQVWAEVVRDAGLVAAETAARRRQLSSTDDSLLAAWSKELVQVQARLAESELKPRADSASAAWRARAAQIEQRLAARSARFASDFASIDANASLVASALPANAALVHYVRYLRSDERTPGLSAARAAGKAGPPRVAGYALPWYGAFVIVARRSPQFVVLGPAATIDSNADRWLRSLASGKPTSARARTAGNELRHAIWDPVAPRLSACSLAIVVPDGPLATLPFATLPAADGTPLLETAPTFHVIGSPRELIARASAPASDRALIVGGVDYGAHLPATPEIHGASALFRGRSQDCRDLAPLTYPPLPGSVEEVRQVAQVWGTRHATSPRLLTGAEASEYAVRHEIAGCSLVHLATHGYLVPDSCTQEVRSTRMLVADLRDIPQPPGAGEMMLRCGLVLAGANLTTGDLGNDGVLTAADIAMLDLTSARLVTLSACESGSGSIVEAEGVIGLRWALMEAGARVALTSSYRVSDERTAQWMDCFYKAWIGEGLAAPDAAREASRRLRKEILARTGADVPGAWGAFMTSGEWR
jgi:CHAT domain-containing protein/tetratricopeptide (TPR) repeat protein